MDTPLISIILPTYNGSRYIGEAIDSVLAQDYENFELIIINDASTDKKVEEIILQYQQSDNRIIYIKNEVNLERSTSKNKGANQAKGDYIAFIDDDDTWSNVRKLEKQIEVLTHFTQVGIVGTYATCIDENYVNIGNISTHNTDADIRNNLLLTNQFIQSSILIRKDIFQKVGGFNESMNLCEDYDLWLRVGKLTEMRNIDEYCTNYMIRISNTTSKNSIKMKKVSFSLALRYRKDYPRFATALFLRLFTFFVPISLIVRIKRFFPWLR
ncbi:MAG: glycosyltransferase [Candidatus Gracilibacteria bacterium]|nr:glycosyltransferase [Candidatus Gracilibacteria bacterium]